MTSILWYKDAENDLNEIYVFYYSKNPFVAIKIYNSILFEVEKLLNWPDIGSIELSGKKYTVRSLVVNDGLFKIIYFVTETTVFITRIWCCRKDPEKLQLF